MERKLISLNGLKNVLSKKEMKYVLGGNIGPMCPGKECSSKSDCTFDKPNCGCIENNKKHCY